MEAPRALPAALLLALPALAGCLAEPGPGEASVLVLRCDPCDRPLAAEAWHEQEPSAAIDPADPRRMLAVFRDDPGSADAGTSNARPGRNAFGTAWSADGGATWQRGRLPLLGAAAPGSQWSLLCLMFDPIAAFGPGGLAHVAGAAVTCAGTSAFFVARSADGGATWGEPALVAQETPAGTVDKPWLAVDPVRGHLAATWTNFALCPLVFSGVRSCGAMDLMASVSTDGGATWRAPVRVERELLPGTPANPGLVGHFSVPAWAGDALHVSYRGCDRACVKLATSRDLGATWAVAEAVQARHTEGPEAAFTMHALDADRSGGPRDGRLYLAYKTAPGGDYDVHLAWSDDGGATWGAPMLLSHAPPGDGSHQVQPWMDVDERGVVHAMYLHLAPEGARAMYARWDPAGGPARHLAASAPWDPDPAGTGSAHHGDYEAIAAAGGAAVLAWTRAGPPRGGAPGSPAASFDLDIHVAVVRGA